MCRLGRQCVQMIDIVISVCHCLNLFAEMKGDSQYIRLILRTLQERKEEQEKEEEDVVKNAEESRVK